MNNLDLISKLFAKKVEENKMINLDAYEIGLRDMNEALNISIVVQRLAKIKSWIEESIAERDYSDDGVTDREGNANFLLKLAIELCDKDF